MPVTRATSSKLQTKNTYQRNKRNISVNDSNTSSSSSKTVDTNENKISPKKQKILTPSNEDIIDPEIEKIITNIISNNNGPLLEQNTNSNMSSNINDTLFEQKTDDDISSTNLPLEMDVDNTSNFTPSQPTLKQTANDSMHAHNNNDNMFEDTGFDYILPPIEKGKKKQSWSEELEQNEGSHDQENQGATYNIITAPTRFYVTDSTSDIKGKSIAEKCTFINSLFVRFNGYQGSTYISKFRKFSVYFQSMEDLTHAITKVQETQHNPIFTIVDPAAKKIKQDAENGRTLKVSDIPLFVKSDVLRNFFSKYGAITRFSMIVRGPWQIAFIVFENADIIKPFYNDLWSIKFLETALRIEPTDLDPMQIALRQQFELKLTGLPYNTDQLQLGDFLTHIKARMCFIPRDQQYRLRPYAFINFASLKDLDAAAAQSQKFKGKTLYWMEPFTKHCHSCGAPGHEFKECTNRKPSNPYRLLYNRFKPDPYRPLRNNTFNNFKGATPYINALKNTSSKNDDKQSPPVTPNYIDALKLVQERLDNIENKLLNISDEIVSIKNDIIEHQQNEEDIGFRLNRLEIMHNIEYNAKYATDPSYVFSSHDDYLMNEDITPTQTQEIPTSNISNDSSVPNTTSTINFQRIGMVESSVNEIKNEMRNLIATIGPIIQASKISQ